MRKQLKIKRDHLNTRLFQVHDISKHIQYVISKVITHYQRQFHIPNNHTGVPPYHVPHMTTWMYNIYHNKSIA